MIARVQLNDVEQLAVVDDKRKRRGAIGSLLRVPTRLGSFAVYVGSRAVGDYVWPGVQKVLLAEHDKRRIQDVIDTWQQYDRSTRWWEEANLQFVLALVCLIITILAAMMKALALLWRGISTQTRKIPTRQIATLICLPSILSDGSTK
jgi:hypothetical protein